MTLFLPPIYTAISTIITFCAASDCFADVRLPKILGDNMVLQRDTNVTLWGWADAGENVIVEFQGTRASAKADSLGQWRATLGAFPAGGPYDMTIKGKNTISVRNLMMGDVWVASGQSNMEFRLKAKGGWMTGATNADEELQSAHSADIRLITIKHTAALEPLLDINSVGWQAVTPETAGDFSAVAYLFAKELHLRYNIPIGIIESDKGDTRAEAWISAITLSSLTAFRPVIDAMRQGDESLRGAYQRYAEQRDRWYLSHGDEDRGRVSGRAVWAAPNLDVSQWATIEEPRPVDAFGRDFGGFDGVVWLRRSISLLSEEKGKGLYIHLGAVRGDSSLYFNGLKIEETEGANPRAYLVPGESVRQGENFVVVRLVGEHDTSDEKGSGVGMFGTRNDSYMITGTRRISLAGTWRFRAGPSLEDYPIAEGSIVEVRPSSRKPTQLFNGMINPLVNFKIKGVIWYQGEGNTDRPSEYRELFPALIRDWRQQWGYEFPFLFVQIAGFGPEQNESVECKWAELREAQTAALALPNVGMVTAVDLGTADDVHPRNKKDVAHRLVLAAAKIAYGENIIASGPTYHALELEGNGVRIKFSSLGGGLSVRDKYGYVRGFELAGNDHQFNWAQGRLDGDDIVLSSKDVEHPMAVRYDWSNTPDGNIFNKEGLPLIPFRTDAH